MIVLEVELVCRNSVRKHQKYDGLYPGASSNKNCEIEPLFDPLARSRGLIIITRIP